MSSVTGTVIRFSNARTSIDVTLDQDNPTVRSLIAQLPLHDLDFADNGGLEKLTRLRDPLDTQGSPASGVAPGVLICFTPWNSIAFWYDPAGHKPEPELVHMGRFEATAAQLDDLEAGPVTAQIVTP